MKYSANEIIKSKKLQEFLIASNCIVKNITFTYYEGEVLKIKNQEETEKYNSISYTLKDDPNSRNKLALISNNDTHEQSLLSFDTFTVDESPVILDIALPTDGIFEILTLAEVALLWGIGEGTLKKMLYKFEINKDYRIVGKSIMISTKAAIKILGDKLEKL